MTKGCFADLGLVFDSAAEQQLPANAPAGYLIIGESADDSSISGYAVNEKWLKDHRQST